jgi:hypothetical protein
MSPRAAFNTGQAHQAAVATWARKRLADRGGAVFDDKTSQDRPRQVGCLFADGVGLGKTWEALASVALLLDKRAWRNRRRRARRARRRKQVRLRRREAHLLILVPPGLVAKWSSEVRNPEGFQRRLKRWSRQGSRGFIERTLDPDNCFEIRRRADLDDLPRGRRTRGRYVLPPGTYLCNWNVFDHVRGGGRGRVAALRNQAWDVVVVDEAHHGRARKALGRLRRAAIRLLLTATPFQLDMTELHGLTKHLVKDHASAHKVLQRGAVRSYTKAADGAFEGGPPPTPTERRAAERVLGQLVACSRIGRQRRRYFAIDRQGDANPVPAPTALDSEEALRGVLQRGIEAPAAFRKWYITKRLDLARQEARDGRKHVATKRLGLARREARERRKYVAMALRKLLSVRKLPPPPPKLDALRTWARQTFIEDLKASLKDGKPRKLLVFTHLKTGVAKRIRQALEKAFVAAHREVARAPEWQVVRGRAPQAFRRMMATLEHHLVWHTAVSGKLLRELERLEEKVRGTAFFDLFGRPGYASRVCRELLRLIGDGTREARRKPWRLVGAGELAITAQAQDGASAGWFAHQAKARSNAALAAFRAVATAPLAATFTGDDTRRERDTIAEAFKTALAPWILVATNVGSEGIDLHAYSRHLVHFDLEWNPARMEQREGRIDRLGRVLKEPARIYYLLVKDTYDERMFHQFIARQRWHAVLLGRKARQVGKEEGEEGIEAPLITGRQAENMALKLDPRVGQ